MSKFWKMNHKDVVHQFYGCIPCYIGLIFISIFLGGCQFWGTAITSAHSLWNVISDDRPLSEDASDIGLYTTIRQKLTAREIKSILDVQITVFQGDVLLTGALPTIDEIQKTVEVVWQIPDVHYVYNYIRKDTTQNVVDTTAEAALLSSIQTKLTLTEGIKSSNYKIVLENGTAYVMGIKQNDTEWDKVRSVLSDSYGVSEIIWLLHTLQNSESTLDNQIN